ncbi:MAG: hypothetical protein ABIY70_02880 [Capsulimonas sp.]|uniref:hypothetical protein n=1 Tax=Capsulimonas sp. TaxID=2494211 RepID=UPI00326776AA
MTKHWAVAIILLLSTAASSQARNDDPQVRKELVVSYHRMDVQLSGPGGKPLITVLNDVMAAGPYKDLLIRRARSTMAAGGDTQRGETTKVKTTITKLVVHGDVALANVYQKGDIIERDREGEFGPKGQIHHLIGGANFLDKWVKQSGKWRLLSEAYVSETMYVDGKKLPPPRN